MQGEVHDTDALQLLHLIAESCTHTTNLTIQSLCDHDMKLLLTKLRRTGHVLPHLTWAGRRMQFLQLDAIGERIQELLRARLIHGHDVFLLMVIPCTVDPIYEIALIRQKDESLRLLIETADRVHSRVVVDRFDDVRCFILITRRAHDPTRLVVREQHRCRTVIVLPHRRNLLSITLRHPARLHMEKVLCFRIAGSGVQCMRIHTLSVQLDRVCFRYLLAELDRLLIYGDTTRGDQLIRLAAGADAELR